MAIPAAVYGIIAIFIAISFILTVRRLDPSFRVATEADPIPNPQE